jgi:hypothetical protein
MFLRRRHSDRELLALLKRVEKPRVPMPPQEDTRAWDDWTQLDELQGLLAGLVSRRLEGASPPTGAEVSQMRVIVANGLRGVGKERADAAAELIDRLTAGHVSTGSDERGVTTFVGVSDDPRRGVKSAGNGLYEFWTDTNVPVRLHDMTFEALDYRYDPRPTLVLRFRYDEAEWTPPEAVATPVVEMTFDDVRVRHWEEDAETLADVDANWGLVSTFDYDERSEFDLVTYSLRLTFSAQRVRIRLIPIGNRPAD